MTDNERDSYQERNLGQPAEDGPNRDLAPWFDAHPVTGHWPVDRDQFTQLDVPETLIDVTKGNEGLVVERLPCILQGGVVLRDSPIERLLTLGQAPAALPVRFHKRDGANQVDGHIAPSYSTQEILMRRQTVSPHYDVVWLNV